MLSKSYSLFRVEGSSLYIRRVEAISKMSCPMCYWIVGFYLIVTERKNSHTVILQGSFALKEGKRRQTVDSKQMLSWNRLILCWKAGVYIRQFAHTLKKTRRDYITGTDIVKGTISIWRIPKSNKNVPWWSKLTVQHVQMYFEGMLPSCMLS